MHHFTIAQLLRTWAQGTEIDKKDYLYGLRLIWVSRGGQLCQFVGSLTVIAEIIGRAKITTFRKRLDGIINLRILIPSVTKELWLFFLYLYDAVYSQLSVYLVIKLRIQKAIKGASKTNIDSPSVKLSEMLRYKLVISEWINAHPAKFAKAKQLKNKIRKKKKQFDHAFRKVMTAAIVIVICWVIRGLVLDMSFFLSHLLFSIVACVTIFLGRATVFNCLLAIVILASSVAYPILFVLWNLLKLALSLPVEILIIKPALGYLYLSERESTLKLVGFIFIFFGFCISLIVG
jgi:hypothetical protein